MRVMVGQGGVEIYIFEGGDLVRLVRDEPGPLVTAGAGEWGRVIRVHPDGAMDIRLAGYSRPKDTPLPRAVGVPRHCVVPCDENGHRLGSRNVTVWGTRRTL
jgi:hypothetical protein